jgi:transposase-like protein
MSNQAQTNQHAHNDPNLQELIHQALKQGLSLQDISTELDIPKPTLYRLIQELFPALLIHIRQQRNLEIIEAYQDSSIPVHQILRQHGISQGTLYNILHQSIPPVPLRRTQITQQRPSIDQAIIDMYTQGYKIVYIQAKTGKGPQYIYKILHANNIPLRRGSLTNIPNITTITPIVSDP